MVKTALIVVDVQRDFCEGGKLAVDGGNVVAERIADYIQTLGGLYDEVVFTMDWHEPWPKTNEGHFSATPDYVDSWPPHCEAGSEGAWFHPAINAIIGASLYPYHNWMDGRFRIFKKGLGKADYSGFAGHNRGRQSLHEFLHSRGIEKVHVVGIAGDYCVLQTALSAKAYGYETGIIPQLVASVHGHEATRNSIAILAAS